MKTPGRLALALLCAGAVIASCVAIRGATGNDYPSATVLYASLAPHSPQLFIADGDGSNARPLLSDAVYDYNPNVSADGQWVVFTSERGGSPDIYRVRVDGTGLQQLTDHSAFDDAGTLSPDGRFLAFVSTRDTGNANIWVLELATGRLRNLTAGSIGDYVPSWSPDSQWIAFSSIRDSIQFAPELDPAEAPRRFQTDIYVIRRDGTGLRRVTTSGCMFSPRWSADGRSIAAMQEDPLPPVSAMRPPGPGVPRGPSPVVIAQNSISRVVSVNPADGSTTVLGQVPGRTGARSPQLIAHSRAVWATFEEIRFSDATPGASGEFRRPSWTADGRIMVFYRARSIPPEPDTVDSQGSPTAFRTHAALDSNFRVMRTGTFPSQRPLKDSDWIVLNDQDRGASHNAIIAVSRDGKKQRLVYRHPMMRAAAPAVSPDGSRVAFMLGVLGLAVEGNASRLAIINADGSGLVEITAAGDHAAYPCWSPDGRKIAYVETEPGGRRGLRIIDLATNTITTVTTGPDNFPSWSPLGDRIAFTRAPRSLGGASQIYSVKPDGTDLKRLTFHPGAQDAHPAFSPDGRWIAFTSTRTNPRTQPMEFLSAHHEGGQIFVMRADGSDVRQLTDAGHHGGTPAWMSMPAD